MVIVMVMVILCVCVCVCVLYVRQTLALCGHHHMRCITYRERWPAVD